MATNRLFHCLVLIIPPPDRLSIISIGFVDNPYHESPAEDRGEPCKVTPIDGAANCHRSCTAYVVSNGEPVVIAPAYVSSDGAIRRARDLTTPVIPVEQKGERLRGKLDVYKSYTTTYRLYEDSERERRFPLAASVSFRLPIQFTQPLLRDQRVHIDSTRFSNPRLESIDSNRYAS